MTMKTYKGNKSLIKVYLNYDDCHSLFNYVLPNGISVAGGVYDEYIVYRATRGDEVLVACDKTGINRLINKYFKD